MKYSQRPTKTILVVIIFILFNIMHLFPSDHVYKNWDHGFELTFPDSWKNMLVLKKTTNYSENITGITYYIMIPTNSTKWVDEIKGYASLFAISVFDPKDWERVIVIEEPFYGLKIADNDKYVFDFSRGNDCPEDLIDELKDINNIKKTFKLLSKKEIKIIKNELYSPTIDNLRFRESPTLEGKFIRSLQKEEVLFLIKKGNEETISNTKGTWVQVQTSKGEIGWSFDAYLEKTSFK